MNQGLLVFYEGVMNERFVAVSTVTGSRICGCFAETWYQCHEGVATGDECTEWTGEGNGSW